MSVVECRGITYAIGDRVLVRDASLSMRAGTVTVVVGPNGAGKSTLLKLLTGQLKPTDGGVTFGDEALAAIPPWTLASRRAVMSQSSGMAFPFSVLEVVSLGISDIGRRLARDEALALLHECLLAADILPLASRDMQTLSGGEQQRVHFARVLAQLKASARSAAQTQQALFLDEPTSSLDLKHQMLVLDSAASLARAGVAVMAILHDLNLAAAYADELVVMRCGEIVATGAPSAVLTTSLMKQVFEVPLQVGVVPAARAPFILFEPKVRPAGSGVSPTI